MKKGTIVRVKNITANNALWAKMYIGQTGVIEGRCQLYPDSWSVRFPYGDDTSLVSLKPEWLEVVK